MIDNQKVVHAINTLCPSGQINPIVIEMKNLRDFKVAFGVSQNHSYNDNA
jgi:hypothetical protein